MSDPRERQAFVFVSKTPPHALVQHAQVAWFVNSAGYDDRFIVAPLLTTDTRRAAVRVGKESADRFVRQCLDLVVAVPIG